MLTGCDDASLSGLQNELEPADRGQTQSRPQAVRPQPTAGTVFSSILAWWMYGQSYRAEVDFSKSASPTS